MDCTRIRCIFDSVSTHHLSKDSSIDTVTNFRPLAKPTRAPCRAFCSALGCHNGYDARPRRSFGVFTGGQQGIHRGLSHSFLFAALGCSRWTANDIYTQRWTSAGAIGASSGLGPTHIPSWMPSPVGTQLFNHLATIQSPFRHFHHRPALHAALLILLLMALGHPPGARARRRLNAAGLIISSSYLS